MGWSPFSETTVFPILSSCILVVVLHLLGGCSLLTSEPEPSDCFSHSSPGLPDSVGGVPLINWTPSANIPHQNCGNSGEFISRHLNLSRLHGEKEFTRRAQFADVNGDGEYDIVTQTMNQNRVRAIDPTTGRTLWISPPTLPPSDHPPVSDLAVADIDQDDKLEVIIASYDGHILTIDATDGSIEWHRDLGYHIDYPGLQPVANITNSKGLELAFTVSRDFEWNQSYKTPRTNLLHNPSLLTLQADGSRAWFFGNYDTDNSRGHWTWEHDLDDDGRAEVVAIGQDKIIVFDNQGERLFNVPLRNNGHPDEVLFGEWTTEHDGPEIIYTDGIRGIGIASSTGAPIDYLQVPDALSGHLQDITLIEKSASGGPYLLAQNIRSENAKTTLYDQTLQPVWTAQLGYAAAMQYTKILDWDGDGIREIATGSVSAGMDRQCSLQIMDLDGSPLYWHRWNGPQFCWILDSQDFDRDDKEELLLGTGSNGGPEGRWSLAEGAQMNLFLVEPK